LSLLRVDLVQLIEGLLPLPVPLQETVSPSTIASKTELTFFGFQKPVYVFESQVYIQYCLVGVSYGLENLVGSSSRLTLSFHVKKVGGILPHSNSIERWLGSCPKSDRTYEVSPRSRSSITKSQTPCLNAFNRKLHLGMSLQRCWVALCPTISSGRSALL
jgi:hypothetical protein